MINVTKPFLPPQHEYLALLNDIWECNWLTNHGPKLQKFEHIISDHLGVDDFHFVANGTMALQIALEALNIHGEVITTPFSFIATTNAILWKRCTPVFVDITPDTFNIDPDKIDAAVTPNTQAILATHIYGNACDIDMIQKTADKHNLKVIYDAAHCFGTEYKSKSIFSYGDISAVSFHATKLFHTIEGGGVFVKDKTLSDFVQKYGNFGFDDTPTTFRCSGVNAKNSEFHAAMGLCNLKYIDAILDKRKKQWLRYEKALQNHFQLLKITPGCTYNYAYFPIVFGSEADLTSKLNELKMNNINIRRYFYPALSKLPYVDNVNLPVVDNLSPRVACLPLYHDLTEAEQQQIIDILLR